MLEVMNSEAYADLPPAQIWARELDEGRYHCSTSTMYRILRSRDQVGERRRTATHPPKTIPELRADGPGQVFTWDITRPKQSNDNPYSEAQFKTLKYASDYPERFESLAHAREWMDAFTAYYNHDHRHSGIGYHTPASVHFGTADQVRDQRAATLARAYAAYPERFSRSPRPRSRPASARRRWSSSGTSGRNSLRLTARPTPGPRTGSAACTYLSSPASDTRSRELPGH
ncbi:integrase core domain-containing protein [Nocardiopsis synnemataformans]|uniref:integrase core domain-containing protein n=1 Tax=Nocardiopsis synnemataformans TaxID=61305 RepID=UPI003EB986D7